MPTTPAGGAVVYDYDEIAATAAALLAQGAAVDNAGAAPPPITDLGLATLVVVDLIAGYGEASARISAEGSTLGGIAEACSSGMQSADAQVAIELLRTAGD